MYRLHKLVALAFLGPRPDGLVINHKDGDRFNNHAGNLEYTTPEENNRHAKALGLSRRKSRNSNAKLTEDDVRTMRRLRQSLNPKQISEMFNLEYSHTIAVINGRYWKHVQ